MSLFLLQSDCGCECVYLLHQYQVKLAKSGSFFTGLVAFLSHSRAANAAVRGQIGPNFKLMQDFMIDFITCKNEEDPIKNEGTRVLTRLYMDFSYAQGQLTPQSVVVSDRNSNSSKLLWLSSLPARNKKIQSILKALRGGTSSCTNTITF